MFINWIFKSNIIFLLHWNLWFLSQYITKDCFDNNLRILDYFAWGIAILISDVLILNSVLLGFQWNFILLIELGLFFDYIPKIIANIIKLFQYFILSRRAMRYLDLFRNFTFKNRFIIILYLLNNNSRIWNFSRFLIMQFYISIW